MKFKYKKFSSEVIRPVIPIDLEYQGKKICCEVLVDSGADNCIFDAQIADLLGIDLKKGIRDEVGGINGQAEPYYIHKIKIAVGGWDYEIFAGFKENFPKYGYGVVGQKGFFEHFVVKFDYKKEEIELSLRKN